MSKVRLVKIWTDQTFDQKIRRFLKNDEGHKYNDAEGDVEVELECINGGEEEYCDGADCDNKPEQKVFYLLMVRI